MPVKLNRRAFISLAALSGATYYENSWSGSPIEFFSSQRYSIVQGLTDLDHAEFSILFDQYYPIVAEVIKADGTVVTPSWSQVVAKDFSRSQLLKVEFSQLDPSAEHQLVIKDPSSGAEWDRRIFKTVDLNSPTAKIAIASCMNDYLHRRAVWQSLITQSPDYIFFVGDSVYADMISQIETEPADPKQLWTRFVQTRNKLQIYKEKRLIPILAIWDDHDFGINNGNRHYSYVTESQENFLSFFAQGSQLDSIERGPGLAFKFSAFKKNFYFLDGRSFRSEDKEVDPTMFGSAQEQWLFSHLQNDKTPSWLINGSQWFGGYLEKESYEYTMPLSFKRFLVNLKSTNVPVQFISGDVHFSEIMEIESEILGYPTLEITSSSIHSLTFPGWHYTKRNPRRVEATSAHNFNVIHFEHSDAKAFNGQAVCLGSSGRPKYVYDF